MWGTGLATAAAEEGARAALRCPFSLLGPTEQPPEIRAREGARARAALFPDGQRMEDGIRIWKILISKISKVRWFLETLVL